ncbi:MAG: ABC transporter substrate-binding protein [Parvibaculum sp.]|uniref:MlaC/ttg2D family ABC transporter substrate-binding protein n=1 Tax=Parvibaculum sp. TaxID=2024848 RepID=UPI0025D14542|nr:ABC transporter substrate-binding protein [Parvibaculum sp.]MCE9650877.1 ABC transporter substrate-binding protein [Parvibaculum sp.]
MTSLNFMRSALAPLAFSFALVTAIAVAGTPAAAAGGDPAAESFVTDVSAKAIDIISDQGATRSAREKAFGQLLSENADMQKIAVFALGQFRTKPDEAQKAEYLKLFDNFVVKVYVTRLSDYHNEKLVITGSGPAKGGAMVDSQINFTNGREPVKIKWWLFKTGDTYKVFDVNVAGIWLAQEQRSAFTSVINNHGGDFSALLDHLQTQISNAETGQAAN